jgi:RNA polymerase sigma-70 factor (ECF subfamily)
LSCASAERVCAIARDGRAAWPSLRLSDEALAAHVAEMPEAGAPSFPSADVFLACACANGVEGAVAEFERTYERDMIATLRRMRASEDLAEEVLQRVRVKLFVASGGARPKIAQYAGRNRLSAWLRALLANELVSVQRATRAPLDEEIDRLLQHSAAPDNPETSVIRARFGPDFKGAFQDAFRALLARDRTVLRLHLLDGLAVEQIAAAYGVHRVSASRWLSHARDALREGTRAALEARLGMTRAELESVLRACMSQLDVSIERVLRG